VGLSGPLIFFAAYTFYMECRRVFTLHRLEETQSDDV